MQENTHSLLVTKLYRPRQRSISVARPRLQQMLTHGHEDGWILVAAAAGAGKTTLIVDWTEPLRERTCWLGLDRGDSDPARFLTYLIAAIQTCDPTIGHSLMSSLQSAHIDSFDKIIDGLLNQLATLTERLIIVLDDYHVIESEEVHQAMGHLLNHRLPLVTFVLLTRADPPLPLARMRANGDLTEIRAQHLAFTAMEATSFFNESYGLELTPEQVHALSERTEGWSAGLQLAALALQSHGNDRASFINSFTGSHRHVLDYLMEEVLRIQPEPVRDFMMRIAPLEQFNVALCDAVLDESTVKNGAMMLDYLETHNLFLVPLDDSRQWYRYHHLFVDLLRGQLNEHDAQATRQIKLAAAEWHAERGDHVDAINYALDAQAYEFAATVMQTHLMTSYWQTSLDTWRRWYNLWPEGFFASSPLLAFLFGHAMIVRGALDEALHLLREVDVDQIDLSSRLMVEFLNIDEQLDASSFAAIAEQAQHQPLNPLERLMLCGHLTSSGDYRAACTMIDKAHEQSIQAGIEYFRVAMALHRCRIYMLAGELNPLPEVAADLLSDIENTPKGADDMFGFAYIAAGRALLAQNRIDESEKQLELALEHVKRTGFVMGVLPTATMMLAEVRQAQGDVGGALTEASRALDHARQHELPSETAWLEAYQVRLQVQQGDLGAGAAWLQRHQSLPPSRFYVQSIYRLVEAEIYLAQSEPERAIRRLTTLTAEPANLYTADAWIALALARQATGDGQHAFTAFSTAISVAEPQKNLRPFLNQVTLHRRSLISLGNRFIQQFPENAFAQDLFSLLPTGDVASAESAVEMANSQSALLDPLSERELEVLRLIVAGNSNKEIAGELILALNTIKWYIKVLYGKLGVQSRSQAIARAHELGLVG